MKYLVRTVCALLVAQTVALSGVAIAAPAALAAPKPTPSSSPTPKPVPLTDNTVVTFGIKPSTADGKVLDPRDYFSYSASPGGTIRDYAAITNYSGTHPLDLLLSSEDAVTTAAGTFSMKSPQDKQTDVGTWINFHVNSLVLKMPPQTTRIVEFSLNVPRNASPGDHGGGLQVSLITEGSGSTGTKIKLLQSVGARMFIRVSGKIFPKLSITNVKVHYKRSVFALASSGTAIVSYTVKNPGNIALGGRQRITVSGLLPGSRRSVTLPDIGLLLPGASVQQTATLSGVLPEIFMRAHISVVPEEIPGAALPKLDAFSSTSVFFAIPWVLIALIVLAPFAVVVIRRWTKANLRSKGSHSAVTAK